MASQRVRTLIDWCRQHRIDLFSITIIDRSAESETDNSGISVLAGHDLANSDIVARIPKSSILSRRTSQLLSDVSDSATNSDDVMELALVLAYELALGEQSVWAGYLQSLPREQVPVAALWDENEDEDSQYAWRWLQETETARLVLEPSTGRTVSQTISDYYNRVADPILNQAGSKVTLKGFRQAWSLVSSRSFRVDSYHGLAMVPIADAFNHIGENQVHIETDFDVCPVCGSLEACPHDEDDQESSNLTDGKTDLENTCDMVMNAPISAGDEIFNSYDTNMSNSTLLARYGFILEGNEHDYVSWDATRLPSSVQGCTRAHLEELAGIWTEELLNDSSLVYDHRNTPGTSVHTDSTWHARSPTNPHYRINSDGLVSVDLWTGVAMCSVKAAGGQHLGSISKSSLKELARAQVAVENNEDTNIASTGDLSTIWLQLRIIANLVQDLCRSRLEGMYSPELSISECGDLLDNLPATMVRSRMAIAQALSERATLIACRDAWGDLMTNLDETILD
ncbi:unnamed protein product [Rhizoctonia solani]|uniref:SET domain-containing protein n=3 Tax=Rhizoctonia solani TaxID=456999 RepID=A0A8H3A2Z9_9AGAM|nr:SET domain protein [Rhizoctonia solani AG-3 Rhs1AP]KEP55223.1 SET domain protein [Rhizoctonia solani 123E]CAE6401786.1 unnamed protein product [Rhizoctonia solani]CAE6530029.1 unnamed protein product [Rhizoctonia solani]